MNRELLTEWVVIFWLGMFFGIVGDLWVQRRRGHGHKKKTKNQSDQLYVSMILGGTASLFLYTFSQLLLNSSPYLGIVSAIAGGMFYPKILPKLEKLLMSYIKSLLPGKQSQSKEKVQ